MLYILEDFIQGEDVLKTNNKFALCTKKPDEIFQLFNEEMKSENASKSIRLIDQFSKSFAESDKHKPIFQLEGIALLYALDHFRLDILRAPLSVLVTDSRVAFFLFSGKVQQSCKKLINWSLKISLSYPTVRILNVRGKQNVSDYLSRLGLPKQIFFARSLTPVKINDNILKSLPSSFSWNDIAKICEENEDMISFSEEKIGMNELNKFYLSIVDTDCPKINSMSFIKQRENYLDKHLERGEIIKHQSLENLDDFEEKNGVKFYNSKPILPSYLYIHAVLREHFLSLHIGKKGLEKACRNIFHFLNLSELKRVISKVCDSCLSCTMYKSVADKQMHGIFKFDKNISVIQMDFIENVSVKMPFLLTIVDVYSRYLSVYLLPTKKTNLVISCLHNYLGMNGPVKYIVTDNYSGFKSKEMVKFLKSQGIIRPESSPYRSRSRGLIEGYNRLLQNAIKALLNVQENSTENWTELISTATFLLNNKKFFNEDLSPAQVHWSSINPRTNNIRPEQQILNKSHVPYKFWELEKKISPIFDKLETELNENRLSIQKKRQEMANKKKLNHSFKIGDYVLIKDRLKRLGVSPKFKPVFEMVPFKILKTSAFNALLENQFDLSTTVRGVEDLKLIKILSTQDYMLDIMPREIVDLMQLITDENIIDLFKNKEKSLNSDDKRTTRQMTSKDKELNEFLENIFEDYFDYEDDKVKTVRFLDDNE